MSLNVENNIAKNQVNKKIIPHFTMEKQLQKYQIPFISLFYYSRTKTLGLLDMLEYVGKSVFMLKKIYLEKEQGIILVNNT